MLMMIAVQTDLHGVSSISHHSILQAEGVASVGVQVDHTDLEMMIEYEVCLCGISLTRMIKYEVRLGGSSTERALVHVNCSIKLL